MGKKFTLPCSLSLQASEKVITATSYSDGVQVDQKSNASYSLPAFTTFCIGKVATCDGGVADAYGGFLDDVRVYNRALSTSEIKQLYNMGR